MQITKERLEHELVKIKSQFPADHVGAIGRQTDFDGNHCIWGQIIFNMTGIKADVDQHRWVNSKLHTDKLANNMIHGMIVLNNIRMPWHQIIDTLVPPTGIEVRDVEAPNDVVEPRPMAVAVKEVACVHA